jgi:hypothetical protein
VVSPSICNEIHLILVMRGLTNYIFYTALYIYIYIYIHIYIYIYTYIYIHTYCKGVK